MDNRFKNCLCQATYKPQDQLAEKVWTRICKRNRRDTLIRLWAFSVAGAASLIVFIPTFNMLLDDFAQSGFYEYLSLAFSSNGTLASYWKEFIFSLAESLPLTSMMLSLALVLVFFMSLRYTIRQITKGQLTSFAKA